MTTITSIECEDKSNTDPDWEEKSSPRLFGSERLWGFKDNLFSGLSSRLEAALQAGFDVAFTDSADNGCDGPNGKMVTSNSSASFSRKSKDRSVFGQPEINYQNQSLHRNKGQSLDSLDTLDSGQSMGSSCTSVSELPNLEIHDPFKFYRTTESLGIGSGQSTSLESSDAEDDNFKRCDSRQSDKSSVSSASCESQVDELYRDSKIFMKWFVTKIFNESNTISLEEKAKFGQMCRTEFGRLWFARYINEQRAQNKRVKESTFYSLAQYFAIVLFECSESDDFTPAKTIMNMCFTYYHETNSQSRQNKQYLYHVLREQPIWRSLRFWNAAFFDALQTERGNRPTPTKCQFNQYNREDIIDENKFQQNITFGQLGAFTHNMHSFGLTKELCNEFLRKQSVIANLPPEQISLLRENIELMYCH